MATKEQLKGEKRKAKKQRRRTKNGSVAWLRLTLKIGRLNKRIARKNRLSAEQLLVRRYLEEAHRCTTLGLTYKWGGGHGESPTHAFDNAHSTGGDCSSYACHLDQTVVDGVQTGTTFTMAEPGPGLEKGEGEHITHFIKNVPASDAHVITRIVFKHRVYWTQCGGRDNTKPGDGPCFFTPTASRIAEFPIKVHPKGL